MPEANYAWIPRPNLLTFEELHRVVVQCQALGVYKVRITGGEPLVRRDVPRLVRMLADAGIPELALTTNGVLLSEQAQALKDAGLRQLTISLDTLSAERFTALTRRPLHAHVLRGLEAAAAAGFGGIKIDTVLMRGVNDDEVPALLDFARERDAEIRFIEYMDVGGATRWRSDQVVTRAELLARLASLDGAVPVPLPGRGSAPAERFRRGNGQVFGIVSSTTQPFCGTCDRARLTAEGQFLTCLYATRGSDLRALLRGGEGDGALRTRLAEVWGSRTDRGAEERARLNARGPLASAEELQARPALEMHHRGG
ncbi:MAG: Cyclic pyranopterin monophosphate synthase 3 [Pseudomonadota bacterium]|jgi:cyclic pyranopterin phosphate synthase